MRLIRIIMAPKKLRVRYEVHIRITSVMSHFFHFHFEPFVEIITNFLRLNYTDLEEKKKVKFSSSATI